MHIVIPCKSLHMGKSRLSGCLDGRARRELCRKMLEQTLECAIGVVAPNQILLLTSDSDAATIARHHSIATVPDLGNGLNSALEGARTALLASKAFEDALLILPIDLPFASPAAIRGALAHAGEVIIAADQCGSGTNLLVLRGAAAPRFAFCYGAGSYALHLDQAHSIGFNVQELHDRRLAFDIDNAAQYATWRSGTQPAS